MNYVYDIYANFQNICYYFYEWDKNDKITHVKKIPMIKLSSEKLLQLVKNENKIDSQFLSKIKDRTEIYKCKAKINACIITDGDNSFIVQINCNGIIIKKSSMLLEEEYDVIEMATRMECSDIEITEIKSLPVHFLTRHELERNKFILKNISKIDDRKMLYLHYECFNIEETNIEYIQDKFRREVMTNNHHLCSTVYNILKLIHANT